jgi:hypothetical protein
MELAIDVDGFECETSFLPETAETCQHFFYEVIRPGLADKRERGKLFLKFLRTET